MCSAKMVNKTNWMDSWSTSIDKLMLWREGTWTKYDSKISNLTLRVHYDQLLIATNSRILESLNMHSKIKGIYKQDILILIFTTMEQEIRKIKFQIKNNFTQCLQKLGEHFPVTNHNSTQSTNVIASKYRNINEVLKLALEKKESTTTLQLPPAFKNFVKLSLLDPTFPQMVIETEKILTGEINKIH